MDSGDGADGIGGIGVEAGQIIFIAAHHKEAVFGVLGKSGKIVLCLIGHSQSLEGLSLGIEAVNYVICRTFGRLPCERYLCVRCGAADRRCAGWRSYSVVRRDNIRFERVVECKRLLCVVVPDNTLGTVAAYAEVAGAAAGYGVVLYSRDAVLIGCAFYHYAAAGGIPDSIIRDSSFSAE